MSGGDAEEVKGLGVVGHQPLLKPGESFQYTSGCRLRTPSGSMQGSYFCVAEDGEPEHIVPADEFALRPEITEEIDAELLRRVGCRDFRNSETGGKADDRACEEENSGIVFAAGENFGEAGADDRAGNGSEEGAEFDDAVAPGEALFGKNFGEQAIF